MATVPKNKMRNFIYYFTTIVSHMQIWTRNPINQFNKRMICNDPHNAMRNNDEFILPLSNRSKRQKYLFNIKLVNL